jgi:toxin-antitoxin system PIN domain toxin
VTYLLDVNVLIALIDPAHVHHADAHDWFARTGAASFATCPITENGVLRIVGHSRYPNFVGTPAAVAPALASLRALAGHEFWADDLSLFDPVRIDAARLLTPGQITDSYLLALAVGHGGRLATFDRKLDASAVAGGGPSLHVIA